MSRRSKAFRIFDYTGGLNTKASVTSLEINQAIDLHNVRFLPNGGFEGRQGNTEFNSSAMVGSSTAVTGLAYYRQGDGDEWLVAVAGTALFKSDSLDGTMDDITGSLVISSNQDNIWVFATLNDILIGVGGPDGTADTPFTWSGTGNGAALGGSPPSGGFIITANNRAFIGDINSNRSRIQWSDLGDHADWTGSGSGNQDVQKNDGDTLVGAAVLNIDHMPLFKQNSIHDLIIRNAPFPLFPLFRNVGAVSKRGIVSVDGVVYFITPEPRMMATDGTRIIPFPDTIDDVWDSLNKTRLKFIHGVYYPKQKIISWMVSTTSATTHDLAIVWDLQRKAWSRDTTGFKMNTSAIAQDRILYTGAYDGKIYKQDVASTFTDASETSPGAIDVLWKSGWMDLENMTNSKYLTYADLSFESQTSGTFDFSYGWNFAGDRRAEAIDMKSPGGLWDVMKWDVDVWGGQTDRTRHVFIKGNGKFLQFALRKRDPSIQFKFNGIELPIKEGFPSPVMT